MKLFSTKSKKKSGVRKKDTKTAKEGTVRRGNLPYPDQHANPPVAACCCVLLRVVAGMAHPKDPNQVMSARLPKQLGDPYLVPSASTLQVRKHLPS